MPYRVQYMPTAVEHLRSLSARQRALVLDTVERQLTHQPDVKTRNRKPMRPNPLAPWELRIGDLRVFYDIERAEGSDEQRESSEEGAVIVLAVGVKKGNRLWLSGEEVEL